MSTPELLPVPRRPRERRARAIPLPPYARAIFAGAAVALGGVGLVGVLELLGFGGGPVELVLLLGFLSPVVVVPGCLIALCFSSSRRAGLLSLLGFASTILCVPFLYPIRFAFRSIAFDLLARRSRPLVAAIHAYETRHSEPPPHLLALVPEFLPEVPGTGMWSYPDFVYWVDRDAPQVRPDWGLRVECSIGFLNWDEFIYSPRGNRHEAGFVQEKSHLDWRYIHE